MRIDSKRADQLRLAGALDVAADGRRGAARTVVALRRMYAAHGRPSIPPEKLLRALVLQLLYSVRSERRSWNSSTNLLFRWFVGLNVDEPVWDASTFSKNRQVARTDRAILMIAGPHAGAALG